MFLTSIPLILGTRQILGHSYIYKNGDLSFLFLNSSNLVYYQTSVHEIGHHLGLMHTFKDDNRSSRGWWLEPKGSSNNFMDYSNILIYFWRWQGINMKTHLFNPK